MDKNKADKADKNKAEQVNTCVKFMYFTNHNETNVTKLNY